MSETERRDEAGRRESDNERTVRWVYDDLIPQIDAERAEPEADVIPIRPVTVPQPRKVRIGDTVYDVYPPEAGKGTT